MLAVSTGAFIGRPNQRNFRLIEEIAPRINCRNFELMFYEDWYPQEKELAEYIKALPYSFPTFHCDKFIGERLAREDFGKAYELFEINCRIAKEIGAGILVIHLWNGPTSDRNIGANISGYPKLMEIASNYGLTATVENVIASGGSPFTYWHRLIDGCPGVSFTYDTKMAQFDSDNERAFSGENLRFWEHIRHIHLNDRAGGYRDWSDYRALNIGEGNVDFESFFKGLKSVGYRGGFTIEANAFKPHGLDIAALNACIEKAERLIGTL